MKDTFFKILLILAALILAVTAAYFSTFGLSKTFAGAPLSVIIMTGGIEFGKLIAVTYLRRHWKTAQKFLRAFLFLMVAGAMLITSIGIYGFLSNAYETQSAKLTTMKKEIAILDKKKEAYNTQIERYNTQLESKSNRIETLTGLRTSQERRLDSLYMGESYISYYGANSVESNIKDANANIDSLYVDITKTNKKIDALNDSIAIIDRQVIEKENSEETADLGALKYLSRLTGAEMDTVVGWLIFIFILIFDPFAIALLIAANNVTMKKKEEPFKKEELKEKKSAVEEKPEMILKKIPENVENVEIEEVKSDVVTENQEIIEAENIKKETETNIVSENQEITEETKIEETIPEKEDIIINESKINKETKSNFRDKIIKLRLNGKDVFLRLKDYFKNND
jgi:hypothetical protein